MFPFVPSRNILVDYCFINYQVKKVAAERWSQNNLRESLSPVLFQNTITGRITDAAKVILDRLPNRRQSVVVVRKRPTGGFRFKPQDPWHFRLSIKLELECGRHCDAKDVFFHFCNWFLI